MENLKSETIQVRINNENPKPISGTMDLTLTKELPSGTFAVSLSARPEADVIMRVPSSLPKGIDITPGTAIFTPGNYSTEQVFTVTADFDSINLKTLSLAIPFQALESNDPVYNGMALSGLKILLVRGDALVVTNSSIFTITEGGTSASFTVRLTTRPWADVTLQLPDSLPEGIIITPASLVFTPRNYNTDQAFTIHASENNTVSGDQSYRIDLKPISSQDDYYNGLTVPALNVTVIDDDTSPTVSVVSPEVNETDVPLYYEVKVIFNKDMDPNTITNATFSLLKNGTEAVPAFLSYNASARIATLAPDGYYKTGTLYRVLVSTDIKDIYGNKLSAGLDYNFTTKYWYLQNLGSAVFGNNISDIFIYNDYAYVLGYSSSRSLYIVPASNPSVLSSIGSINLGTSDARRVWVDNTNGKLLAYVSCGTGGLKVIDVSNPYSPVDMTVTFDTATINHAYMLKKNNVQYLYAAAGANGLVIYDVTTLTSGASKTKIGSVAPAGCTVNSVYVTKNRAYLTAGNKGLKIINIADPASPQEMGGMATTNAMNVYVMNNYALVADGSGGMRIIDISNPSSPSILGTWVLSSSNSVNAVYGIGKTAYVMEYKSGGYMSGLRVIDISNAASPSLISDFGVWHSSANGKNFHMTPTRAFIAMDYSGIYVIDITNPYMSEQVGIFETAGTPYNVWVSGSHALVADYDKGLMIVDVSNPSSPVSKGSYDTTGNARSVTVSGNTAFLADEAGGLKIFNITDKSNPELLTTYNTTGNANDIIVSNNIAYVACGTSGLKIFDVTYPSNPSLLGSLATLSFAGNQCYGSPCVTHAYGISLSGNYIYIASGDTAVAATSFFSIVDVSNTSSPSVVSSMMVSGYARKIAAHDGFVFIASHNSGLQIFDVSVPASPVLTIGLGVGGQSTGIFVEKGMAFLSTWNVGMPLVIFDVTNPQRPFRLENINSYGNSYGNVFVTGGRIYLPERDKGLQIFSYPWLQ